MKAGTLKCAEARLLLYDEQRGRLAPELAAALNEHLESCSACRARAEAEKVLSALLEQKLPRYGAPWALTRRLASIRPQATARRRVVAGAWVLAVAAAVAVAVGSWLFAERGSENGALLSEAVNDHLRVLEGTPVARVEGGLHEVKPWFGGKLDFAPAVRFAGDSDFPLAGGAVERFLDRRAAVFVYQRRLHKISLFVVRADGLSFPMGGPRVRTLRGFHIVLWQSAGEGFALASDLDQGELLELQQRIARASGQ